MQVDRGPWRNPHTYLTAIGERELEWTKRFGKPLEKDFPYNMLLPGLISPSAYSALLEKYVTVAPFLLPKDPGNHGNAPTLRHPDLTPSNVLVSPETFQITSIIDWQHTVIIPRLLASGHPRFLENPDVEPPPTLDAPQPPEEYESLDPEMKAQVDELLRRRHLYYFYRVFNGAKNQLHLAACADPLLESRKHLVDYAGRQWNGNVVTLRGALIRMREYWPLLQDQPEMCPIEFTGDELKRHSEDEPTWFDVTALVNYWREEVGGMSEEGWVRSEVYDHAAEKNRAFKEKFLNDVDPDEVDKVARGWPFQNKEESF